jgi:hypothetical protein
VAWSSRGWGRRLRSFDCPASRTKGSRPIRPPSVPGTHAERSLPSVNKAARIVGYPRYVIEDISFHLPMLIAGRIPHPCVCPPGQYPLTSNYFAHTQNCASSTAFRLNLPSLVVFPNSSVFPAENDRTIPRHHSRVLRIRGPSRTRKIRSVPSLTNFAVGRSTATRMLKRLRNAHCCVPFPSYPPRLSRPSTRPLTRPHPMEIPNHQIPYRTHFLRRQMPPGGASSSAEDITRRNHHDLSEISVQKCSIRGGMPVLAIQCWRPDPLRRAALSRGLGISWWNPTTDSVPLFSIPKAMMVPRSALLREIVDAQDLRTLTSTTFYFAESPLHTAALRPIREDATTVWSPFLGW